METFRSVMLRVSLLSCLVILLLGCRQQQVKNSDAHYNKIYENATNIALASGDKNKAMLYVDSVYFYDKDPGPYGLYKKYDFKKNYYYYSEMYDSSYTYVDSILHLLEDNHLQQQYPREYAAVLNDEGDRYYTANNLTLAFQYYYKSKQVAEPISDSCALGNQSYHLGMVSYRQEKYSNAIDYFQQSFLQNEACLNDTVPVYRGQELLDNIALSYNKLKKSDSAILYYRKTIDYINRNLKKFGPHSANYFERAIGVVYGNLAVEYATNKNYDSAEYLLLKSIAINSKPDYENRDAQSAQLFLVHTYLEQDKLDKALAMLMESRKNLDTLRNMDAERNWNQYMGMYYQKVHQWENALIYYQHYIKMKDSLTAINKNLQNTDVSALLKKLDDEYKFSLLKKDNQVKQLYLWITIGFSIMAITLAFVIFINYKESKKNIRKLTSLNYKVHEQKDQLEFALKELGKSNKEKDRIVRVVAHDLRNPLGGIAATIDSVMEEDELPKYTVSSLKVMKKAAIGSLELIHELLEISNKEAVLANNSVVDLNALLKDAVSLLQFKAQEKQQSLELIQSREKILVNGNSEKLTRVINNLITNAIKFSPVKSNVSVSLHSNDQALITIKDNGIGIPDEIKDNIFDTLTSAKRKGTEGEKSYGLGLSICKQIVEEHKGKIWVESKEGEGAMFFVSLPISGENV